MPTFTPPHSPVTARLLPAAGVWRPLRSCVCACVPAIVLVTLLFTPVTPAALADSANSTNGSSSAVAALPTAAPFNSTVSRATAPTVTGSLSGQVAPHRPSALDRAGELGSNALVPFVAVTELALLTNGDHRGARSLRGGEAFATTFALTEALKFLTHERRPNGVDNQSFPSGHASLSFAAATLLDAYQPRYKGLGYGVATWISLSRVQVKAHYFHDVLAGAVLGSVVTRQFTRKYRDSGGGSSFGPVNLPAASSGGLNLAASPAAAFPDQNWRAGFSGRGITFGRSW